MGEKAATPSSVSQSRSGLLEDLLLHEMTVGPELDGARIGVNHLDLTVGGNEFTRLRALVDLPGIRTNVDDVALVNIDDAIRRAADRHGVGGNEVLTVADTHDHGRALTGGDDAVGLVGGDHGNGIAAAQARDGLS